MPADFSNYIELRSFDVSPTEIYLDAIDYARIALPEFQLRQGTPEDGIMQAVSYISALNVAAINRLPDRLMSGILGMMGVQIDDGQQALIDVEFTGIDYDGASIPQGTVVRYDYEYLGEQSSVYFQTIEEGIISPVTYTGTEPLPTVVVEAQALDVGRILPLTVGLELFIDTPTSEILGATVNSVVSYGTNPETSEEYLNRSVKYLGSLSSSFAKASQIDAYVLSQFSSSVSRCKTYDLTNYTAGMGWLGEPAQGYVTVVTYGIGGQLTTDEKNDILISVQDRTIAGLEVLVVESYEAVIQIDVNATYSSEYDSEVVENNIKSVLATLFSPENYRFSERIRKSEFLAAVSSVPGVLYIETLEVSVISGPAIVAVPGDVSFENKGTLPFLFVENINVIVNAASEY